MKINQQFLVQAAIAAAFSAGFNSAWFKDQFEKFRREVDFGPLAPFVPWAVVAGAVYLTQKGKR